jgi:hypothetical protein
MAFLDEMPPFVWLGVWVSSLKKLRYYWNVFFGFVDNWKGGENWLRLPFRIAACLIPRTLGGLSDHMPGDYYQQVVNSNESAWQPLNMTGKGRIGAKKVNLPAIAAHGECGSAINACFKF